MRTTFVFVLLLGGIALGVSCHSGGSVLHGSTYCDPKQGSNLVPMTSVPSGACTGNATCIAFTAGKPCANPAEAAGECQWTCTCVENDWECTPSCGGAMCSSVKDAAVEDDADTD